ncbi:hypothetical protein CHS0354_006968 [Potamilus streckersoni]|uniref:EFR3-like protein n=1 Tax=Potamilus streckersoni TaxID=2493646 RepID=A0AAE0RWG9_9BIVA|nr:hypothetical protein CHS0354_006968 [Potamilus streckersoni]
MSGCCGCCAALKPRYKRLVDNIFPVNPEDGLVKNNMDKLTFYALSAPEKLDRIGQYLAQRLSRDVQRHRYGMVVIAMDALDQLLVSCHDYSLNLFVESFLKMVQKLLECDEVELQILATSSFIKFANIEEVTPSYHRRYDFFISKFSSMCHSNNNDETRKARIRTAGLKGLQGVVRKTVSDDLQVNIWEPIHMDKIVPSLLYNMHDQGFVPVDLDNHRNEEAPAFVAETVFRDLVCRASFGNIKSVLKPVLVHIDNHQLWCQATLQFVVKCFKIIMFSVQQQYAYIVIQVLMSHLDSHVRSSPDIKSSIVDVLFECVLIAAGGSIGPSVLDVFNNLVRHLRISLDSKSTDIEKRNMEKKFEEAIISTIGEFANNLPDYQKIEIMMFIMAKFPQFTSEEEFGGRMDAQLQTMLLKTLLKVATKYKTVSMANAFPPEFLHPLLRMSLLDDPGMRIIVQQILHTLIDRNDNTPKFKHVVITKDISKLGLKLQKSARQDSLFMKKNGSEFYGCLLENMQMDSNKVDNFEALYCTMALICVEMGCTEILLELIRFALELQNIAINKLSLPLTHKCAIHALTAGFFNFLAQLADVKSLVTYVSGVIEIRRQEASHLLPEVAFNRANKPSSSGTLDGSYPEVETLKDTWLFQQSQIAEILTELGHDVSRLSKPFTYRAFSSLLESDAGSSSDIQSIYLDMESKESSPVVARKRAEEVITVESLKKMLAEDSTLERDEEERRRKEILQTFQTAPFEEIVARSESKSNHFHNKLNEILELVSKHPDSPGSLRKTNRTTVPVFDIQFPELYVY